MYGNISYSNLLVAPVIGELHRPQQFVCIEPVCVGIGQQPASETVVISPDNASHGYKDTRQTMSRAAALISGMRL
jgi:hypothetical protein